MMPLLSLAPDCAQKNAEENIAASRRLRIENVPAQAAAAAEAWF